MSHATLALLILLETYSQITEVMIRISKDMFWTNLMWTDEKNTDIIFEQGTELQW